MQSNSNTENEIQTNEILDYYAGLQNRSSPERIVEMLRELQEVNGCIGPGLREMAAQAADVKVSTIQAIIKRIPSLKESAYRHEIVFCIGKNCAAKGSLDVLQKLKQKLGINGDGISRDGTVYLKTRSCLKHCRTAPNVMVDGCLCCGKSAEEIAKLVSG